MQIHLEHTQIRVDPPPSPMKKISGYAADSYVKLYASHMLLICTDWENECSDCTRTRSNKNIGRRSVPCFA